MKSTLQPKTTKQIKKEIVSQLKEQKLRAAQDRLMEEEIEENKRKHVLDLISSFNPPLCKNCENRKADRVCVNITCGVEKYMSIICGRCHSDEHAKATIKPEIDIIEFFGKVFDLVSTSKKQVGTSQIITSNLSSILDNIAKFRMTLAALKEKLSQEIKSEQRSPFALHGQVSNCIVKALSKCDYDNIQQNLKEIRRCVIFKDNKFILNDFRLKWKQIENITKEISPSIDSVSNMIKDSYIGSVELDLHQIEFRVVPQISCGFQGEGSRISKKKEVIVGSFHDNPSTIFMNYQLDSAKKYRMRFRFLEDPKISLMVGIMPFNLAEKVSVYNVYGEYFVKRFFSSSPTIECSHIVRGIDLSNTPKEGMQIEMRFCVADNYIDFYDFPHKNNINRNLPHNKVQQNQPYVIAFYFYGRQGFVIEKFEEVISFEDL